MDRISFDALTDVAVTAASVANWNFFPPRDFNADRNVFRVSRPKHQKGENFVARSVFDFSEDVVTALAPMKNGAGESTFPKRPTNFQNRMRSAEGRQRRQDEENAGEIHRCGS